MKIRNLANGNRTCLDAQGGKKGLRKPVTLYGCHRQGGNQVNMNLLSLAMMMMMLMVLLSSKNY